MEILIGEKGTGKTRALIEKAFNKGAILAVKGKRERDLIWEKSRLLGCPIEVITYKEVMEIENKKEKVYIDELDQFLKLINENIIGFSFTEKEKI